MNISTFLYRAAGLFLSAQASLCLAQTAQQTPQQWTAQKAQEIMQAPLTLDGAIATSWYQIPERDLRSHNVDQDWYEIEIKPKLDDYSLNAFEPIKQELQKRFDNLNFAALQNQRNQGQSISYCQWIPLLSADGSLGGSYDLAFETYKTCRKIARLSIERMLAQHIDEQSTKLDDIAHIDLEFPQWLLADIANSYTDDQSINPLEAQQSYLKSLSGKINLAIPELKTAISGHFAQKTWHGDNVIAAPAVCQTMLGKLMSAQANAQSRHDVYQHCIGEAKSWMERAKPEIIAALSEKMQSFNIQNAIPSENFLCTWTLERWFGKEPQAIDDFIASIFSACLEKAKPFIENYIATSAQKMADQINQYPATLAGLKAHNWFAISESELQKNLFREDQNKQSVLDRLFALYQDKISKHQDEARENAQQQIDDQARKAVTSYKEKQTLFALCGHDFSGRPLGKSIGVGGVDISSVQQHCLALKGNFMMAYIQNAMAQAHMTALDSLPIIAQGKETSASWTLEQLVARAALNDLQILFEKGGFFSSPSMTIRPIGSKTPTVHATLKNQGNSYEVTAIDPIVGYRVEPISVLSCITYTADDLGVDATIDAGLNALSVFFGGGIVVDTAKWFDIGACLSARNSFLANAQ